MAVERIPEKRKFTCDACGNVETLEAHANRPKYWSDLTIAVDAYDYGGYAVADGTVHRLLCGGCTEYIGKAINEACLKIKGPPTPG